MKVQLIAPSGAFDQNLANEGRAMLESKGLDVQEYAYHARFGRFAATDAERFRECWEALCSNADAVWAIRGGYGVTRIIPELDKVVPDASFKWLVGYSDLTALHCWIHYHLGWPTIHGVMVQGIPRSTEQSVDSVIRFIEGEKPTYIFHSPDNHPGEATGTLVGGNLSVLHGLLDTPYMPDPSRKILFLEEINEHWYKVDRMLYSFFLSGYLSELKGIVFGGFTEMPENDMNLSFRQMVMEKVEDYDIPVAFGLPTGHQDHNLALKLNSRVSLRVEKDAAELEFLE